MTPRKRRRPRAAAFRRKVRFPERRLEPNRVELLLPLIPIQAAVFSVAGALRISLPSNAAYSAKHCLIINGIRPVTLGRHDALQ